MINEKFYVETTVTAHFRESVKKLFSGKKLMAIILALLRQCKGKGV